MYAEHLGFMDGKLPASPTILFVYGAPDPPLARALERQGFGLHVALNRSEAIARLAEASPRCVFVDLAAAGGEGVAVIFDLKAAVPNLRIVVLTHLGAVVPAVDVLRLGAAECVLLKPVETHLLLAAVEPGGSAGDPSWQRLPTLDRMQWEYIQTVLGSCSGNVSEAARKLGVYRQSLQRMLRRHPPPR